VATFPAADAALRAAPNPFNPATTLRFALAHGQRARLVLYDSRGRRVRTLVDEERGSGEQVVRWDGRDDAGRAVAAGTYVARLRTDAGTGARVLTLVK
jgi:flagellar hook assembly protein FlgD